MKMKHLPLVAFASFMVIGTVSEAKLFERILGKAGRKIDNLARNCSWDYNDPVDVAISNYERLTTALPVGLNRQVTPFKESDFQTKPWMREFEYVIVVNNSNSFRQNEKLPQGLPVDLPSLSTLGIIDSPTNSENSVMPAQQFVSQYGSLAFQVRRFGALERDANKKPIPSGIRGAQTIRIYQRGQLLRVARVSTGRHEFELRDRTVTCGNRPAESYYSVTESGYYTFQELMKDYKSKSFDDADMPNSMFYIRNRGIALHEVNLPEKLANLGKRASGGCTRLDPDTASSLFEAVYATQGARIPVIDLHGNPVRDAFGRQAYKEREEVVYNEGETRQRRVSMPTYSALLIVQPDSVEPLNPASESQAQFRYRAQ